MCGIAGFAGKPKMRYEETFQFFMDALLVETQVRGEHATGIAAFMGGTKSIIGKGPVNATNFIKVPVWKKSLEAKSMIAHCRYATHGSPGKNENNHPFEQGRWAMIHNGVISDYSRIARKENVKLSSECDSEIILRVFAKYAGKENDAHKGLQGWMDSAGDWPGRYAIALLDRSNGAIRLLRNEGSPCSILRLPNMGVVVFASTKEILSNAFDKTFSAFPADVDWSKDAEQWDCIRDRIYVLRPETLDVEHEELKIPRHEFKPTSYGQDVIGFRPTNRTTYSGGWAGSVTDTASLCRSCGQPDCQCDGT